MARPPQEEIDKLNSMINWDAYMDFRDNEVVLDGNFTAEHLEKIAGVMRQAQAQAQPEHSETQTI